MAKIYRVGPGTRLVNLVFAAMTRRGLGKDYRHLLTVRGRKTGEPRTTPVDVMSEGDRRWLVAAYGVTNWVHNARAAGEVTISRGRRDGFLIENRNSSRTRSAGSCRRCSR